MMYSMTKAFYLLLVKRGLSVEEFAEKVGVSHQAVYKWKSGNTKPTLKKMRKISEVLKIEPSEVFKMFYE